MNSTLSFDMQNFVPRDGVTAAVNHILALIANQVPAHPGYVARIIRQGDTFKFIISLRTVYEEFESETTIDTLVEPRCRDRHWQIGVVRELAEKIKDQVIEWRGRRFEVA